MRVLILGGTSEARDLAQSLLERGVTVTSSLAGRVSKPVLPVGEVRIGGFGGAAGLVDYLRSSSTDLVVDATHPFAATITASAASAAAQTGTPLIVVRRPGWVSADGDAWTRVPTIRAAADALRESPEGTVFLTTGRRDLTAFAADDAHHYLVRTVDPPAPPLPRRVTLVLDRGPYTRDGERNLMTTHGVTVLVTKDSGGELTRAKLDVARELNVPVVMVDRPPLPPGVETVVAVSEVLTRLGIGAA